MLETLAKPIEIDIGMLNAKKMIIEENIAVDITCPLILYWVLDYCCVSSSLWRGSRKLAIAAMMVKKAPTGRAA